jgi:hypothetical protein
MGLSINDTAPDFEADTIQGRMSRTTVAAATVVAVLLADGWHRVVRGSFTVGPLDFCAGADPDMPGFYFEEADNGTPHRPAALVGPLNSILAIRQASSAARHLTALDSSGVRHRGHTGRGGRTAARIAPR